MDIRASQLLHWMIKRLGDDQLEPITDLIIAKQNGRIEAIAFDTGYLFLSDEILMQNGYILITQSLSQLEKTYPFIPGEHHLAISQIMGKPIYNHQRQLIGVVGDCVFNFYSKQLIAIECSQGLLSDLLAGRKQIDYQVIEAMDDYKIVTQ